MDIVNELSKTRDIKHPSHSKRSEHPSPLVLTPHAGELARLSRQDKSWILRCPEQAVRDAATRWNAVVVLKGSTTLIATPSGCMWRHDGDDVGLATSGSGDVLAGLLVGLVARGAPLHQASVWAVRLHARAGAALASRIGPMGYLAHEISEEVPPIMSDLVGATAALMQ
jgi:NAD(P)H-hydrate repair Nnr-like enzyme with NAD(P)H-hydrate dehydratase domain